MSKVSEAEQNVRRAVIQSAEATQGAAAGLYEALQGGDPAKILDARRHAVQTTLDNAEAVSEAQQKLATVVAEGENE